MISGVSFFPVRYPSCPCPNQPEGLLGLTTVLRRCRATTSHPTLRNPMHTNNGLCVYLSSLGAFQHHLVFGKTVDNRCSICSCSAIGQASKNPCATARYDAGNGAHVLPNFRWRGWRGCRIAFEKMEAVNSCFTQFLTKSMLTRALCSLHFDETSATLTFPLPPPSVSIFRRLPWPSTDLGRKNRAV